MLKDIKCLPLFFKVLKTAYFMALYKFNELIINVMRAINSNL
jgi:hypothetical protein